MANEVKLGKIRSVKFGLGGYQDEQIGLWIDVSGDGWYAGHSIIGGWKFPPDKNAKWTLEEQSASYTKMVREINKVLGDAKVDSVDKLAGVPVECEFDFTTLKNFRILTEVL